VRVGEKIRKLRRERELTQDQLAKKAGLNGRHVNRIEKGHVRPNPDTVNSLARALHIEPSELLRDVEDASPPPRGAAAERNAASALAERLRERLADVPQLPAEDQEALIRVIDAMRARLKIQKLVS
jgi:transcriptional regulator with XRE-family HTH domain